MLEYRYDTQLLIEGNDLCEDSIHDYFMENFQEIACLLLEMLSSSNPFSYKMHLGMC